MMLLASLFILMTIGGYLCQDNDDEISCYEREMAKCHDTISLPSEYPQTPEDLMVVCQTVMSMQSCALETKENCDDVPESTEFSKYQRTFDYLKATCQEDNPTFKVVASNLPCVDRVLESQDGRHCRHFFSEEDLEAILAEMRILTEEDFKSLRARCLEGLLDVTCQGVIFGYHCGDEMKEAAEEIKAHFHSQDYMECSAEQLEELSPFLTVFEGLILEEIRVGKQS